jgi:rhamnulokinase
MQITSLLAFDLGAESGRALRGAWDGTRLEVEAIHRFPNRPVRVHNSLHWDVLALHAGIEDGVAAFAARQDGELASVGIDTWGVDFALLDRDDRLLGMPYHYRDARTTGMFKAAFAQVPRDQIFAYTGIQFLEFNTLFQLLAMRQEGAAALENAKTLLMMPDLFSFWLAGTKQSEWTVASTSQLCDPRSRGWSRPLLDALRLPFEILPPIVEPGAVLGPLLPSVATRAGLGRGGSQVQVIAPASHDTGSAVVAVPATTARFGYISSGTWSLVGAETEAAALGDNALRYNFTNEGGVGSTFRVLKNISGLWLLQECRRTWARQGTTRSYADLVAAAEAAPAFGPLINPNHADLVAPADMPAAIRERCRATGQRVPETEGEIVRCALESLALAYRQTFTELAEVIGYAVDAIHVVGGGSQNRLLCQFTADACGVPVAAGPVEATAIGNLLVQMLALGLIGSIAEGREIVRASTMVEQYMPRDQTAWMEAYGRFQQLAEMEEASR